MFKLVGVACVLAMKRSKWAGANLSHKKSTVISIQDESIILNHMCASTSHSRGLQRQIAYFLLCRFGIRDGAKVVIHDGAEVYNL